MGTGSLGKGLSALLPIDLDRENGDGEEIFFYCHIDRIMPNPDQPRKEMDLQRLKELASSIEEKGILQPLVVRKGEENTYQLIAGERRWRAAKMINLTEVPVVVRAIEEDVDQLEIALIENIQRQNLNPVEEAECYHRLSAEFGLTQEQVAKKVGKERSTVANALRLLHLPKEIRKEIAQGIITAGHARALLVLQKYPSLMGKLREQIVSKELSVRQAEKLAKNYKREMEQEGHTKKTLSPKPQAILPESYCQSLCSSLEKTLGTKSRIVQNGSRGKIELEYYSSDDLERLLGFLIQEKR